MNWDEIFSEVNRAPSVHNVQPAFWKVSQEKIELWADPTRQLKVGDPTGNDHRMSLGASWFGLECSLRKRGFDLELEFLSPKNQCEGKIASFLVKENPKASSSEYPYIFLRKSWRGKFDQADAKDFDGLRVEFQDQDHVYFLEGKEQVKKWSHLAEKASYHYAHQKEYYEELYHWLRLYSSHPQWNEDGLNAEALQVSGVERILAGWVMKPNRFNFFRKIGLDQTLLTEMPKNLSATAFMILSKKKDEDPIYTGRNFYRTWLKLTKACFYACPISALTDFEETKKKLEAELKIPSDHTACMAFRIGVVKDPKNFPLSPRRSLQRFYSLI